MYAFEGSGNRLNGPVTMWIGVGLLVAASALFVVAQVSIYAVNGLWGDELYSLMVTDVSRPFIRAFSEYIAPDSNPPLYYVVLYWARWLVTDDRMAFLAVNVAAMVIAAGAVLVASRRAGLSGLGLAGLAAFILSGPVLLFASEGRSYCLGVTVVFVASWYTALAIKEPHKRPTLASFIALGAVAALTHVYAALLCGGLGAGLLSVALFSRRRELVGSGLALGLSASVVFAIWLSTAWGSLGDIAWIKFSPIEIYGAAAYVKNVAIGWNPTILFLIFLLVFGTLDRATRPFFITFGFAFALFVLLPVIASLKQPIITGRYWLVGAPALITLVIFAAWIWFLPAGRIPEEKGNMRFAAVCSALLFLAGSNIHGLVDTRYEIATNKLIWRGAEIVRPLLDGCPVGSVHVATTDVGDHYPSFVWGFSKMTGASPSVFVDAKLQSTPSISPTMTPCPVLGWGEQNGYEFIKSATNADLLRFLKIEASPDEVNVRRHLRGFVVLKRILSGSTPDGSH